MLLAVALVALVVVARFRFGLPASPDQGVRWLAAYVGLLACVGLSVGALLRRRALRGALPFDPGVYAFALDVVDARTRELVLYPLDELVSVEPAHHEAKRGHARSTVWFVFPTASFAFEVPTRERAERQVARVIEARQRLLAAMQYGDLSGLASVDPFADARARNFQPAHDHGLLARDVPRWTRWVWGIAALAGLALGPAAWRARNILSDRRALARATDLNSASAYVAANGRRAAFVREAVLPRLVFEETRKEPDRVAALERFLVNYPSSPIAAEAKAALAEVVHAEYARKTGVRELRAFVQRWPSSPDAAAANARIAELERQTQEDFKLHANHADRNVVPVVTALLAWAAKGRPIDVKLQGGIQEVSVADRLLGQGLLEDDGKAAGGGAELGRHFAGEALGAREASIVRGLEQAFRRVFPADVLALVRRPAEASPPSMTVHYDVSWNGTTFTGKSGKRRYLGIIVKGDVAVQVPDDPHVLEFGFRAEPPDSLTLEGMLDDAAVYDAMLVRAMERVSAQLFTVVFDTKTAAERRRE